MADWASVISRYGSELIDKVPSIIGARGLLGCGAYWDFRTILLSWVLKLSGPSLETARKKISNQITH